MTIAIHQPYLFPYKGYFDLIKQADAFVFYDDAKYMKGKFINRNYYPQEFTFRLKHHSDYALINELEFFDLEEDKRQFLRKTRLHKAEKYLNCMFQTASVYINIRKTTEQICKDLGITTPFFQTSQFKHRKGVQGVKDIVKALGGDTYINLPGGKTLYDQRTFGHIRLRFIETKPGPSILYSL